MIINPNTLFKLQYKNGELQRYDIVVYYIAVDSYVKFGKLPNLYRYFCYKRAEYIETLDNFDYSKDTFTNTINSFINANKFHINNYEPIEVYNDDYFIVDGAHRLAICLYFNFKVNVQVLKTKNKHGNIYLDFPNKLFLERVNFIKEYIDLLYTTEDIILKNGRDNGTENCSIV